MSWEDWVSEVILCDIDNDNYIEIIVGSFPWDRDSSCLYVYRWDGSPQPGWPKYYPDHVFFHERDAHFAIGDIDNDQEIEMIFGCNPLYILDQNGNPLPGACDWHSPQATNYVIANIDFTPEKEIIAEISRSRVSAFYYNSEVCYGWPLKTITEHFNRSNDITIDDIDNDGLIELGVLLTTYVCIWKLHGKVEDIEWGRPYYDLQRTCHFRRE